MAEDNKTLRERLGLLKEELTLKTKLALADAERAELNRKAATEAQEALDLEVKALAARKGSKDAQEAAQTQIQTLLGLYAKMLDAKERLASASEDEKEAAQVAFDLALKSYGNLEKVAKRKQKLGADELATLKKSAEETRKANADRDKSNKVQEDRLKKLGDHKEKFDLFQGIASQISGSLGKGVGKIGNMGFGLAKTAISGNKLAFAAKLASIKFQLIAGAISLAIKGIKLAIKGMQKLIGMAKELSKILAEGVVESGLQNFESLLTQNVAATNRFGLDAKATGKLLSGLNQGFQQFALVSRETQDSLIGTGAALDRLGVGGAESGKMFKTLVLGLRMTGDEVAEVGDRFVQLGQSTGKATKDVVADFNQMSSSLAQFGGDAIDVFERVSKASARLGVSADTINKFFDATTTFQGAADMAAKLNGVLGTTVDAMELINAETPEESINLLKDSLMDAGMGFEDMTLQQKRFLADATSIDMGELQNMLSGGEQKTKSPGESALESLAKKAMDIGTQIQATFDKVFNALAESGVLSDLENTLGTLFGEGSATDSFANAVIPHILTGAKLLVMVFNRLVRIFRVAMLIINPIMSVFGFVLNTVTAIVYEFERMGNIIFDMIISPFEEIVGKLTGTVGSFFMGIGKAIKGGAEFLGIGGKAADDYTSKGGGGTNSYGQRMLFDKGELIALNDGDTIIAGTNIQLANDLSAAANQRTTNNATSNAGGGKTVVQQRSAQPSEGKIFLDGKYLGRFVDGLVEAKLSVAG